MVAGDEICRVAINCGSKQMVVTWITAGVDGCCGVDELGMALELAICPSHQFRRKNTLKLWTPRHIVEFFKQGIGRP